VIEEEGLLQNAAAMGEYLTDCLEEIRPKHPSIGDIRGRGLMIGVDFVIDQHTKEPAREWRDCDFRCSLRAELALLAAGPSAIRIIPPLSVNKAEIDEAVQMFDRASQMSKRRISERDSTISRGVAVLRPPGTFNIDRILSGSKNGITRNPNRSA